MEKNIYITPDIQIDVLNVELMQTLSVKNTETYDQFAPENNGLWEDEVYGIYDISKTSPKKADYLWDEI